MMTKKRNDDDLIILIFTFFKKMTKWYDNIIYIYIYIDNNIWDI